MKLNLNMKTFLGKLLGVGVGLFLSLHAVATTYYVDVSNTAPVAPYTNWPTASKDIQSAVDAATDGDLILVTNGLYNTGGWVVYGSLTNRVVINKAVSVRSVNGPAVTMIQGYQIPSSSTAYSNNVRCVYMTNNATLSGFIITGGGTLAAGTNLTQLCGGGVFCESTNAILTNCVLAGNICESQYAASSGGGAIYQGTLNFCILSNNLVSTNTLSYWVLGGAAYKSVLNNCLIISNISSFGGGAAKSILNRCSIIGNAALGGSTVFGGGTYACTASFCLIANNFSAFAGGGDCVGNLNCCILCNNTSTHDGGGNGSGGGSYLGNASSGTGYGFLQNCLVVSNFSNGKGGGISFNSGGSMANCTIVGNTATIEGGGVYNGNGTNCIVYGNYCPSSTYGFSSNLFAGAYVNSYLSKNPLFVDMPNGNFRLQTNSPCIDKGYGTSVPTDLDGRPRIINGLIDIGAYEFQGTDIGGFIGWLQQYCLPTDGSADYTDSDGTGMNNWQKWIAGLNPTNSASVLAMQTPVITNSATGVTVNWQSVNTRTYYLQRATDLTAQPAFTAIQSNLVGLAGSTSYKDTSATNGGPYFYRIGVQ
jgi:hypothetical protein